MRRLKSLKKHIKKWEMYMFKVIRATQILQFVCHFRVHVMKNTAWKCVDSFNICVLKDVLD